MSAQCIIGPNVIFGAQGPFHTMRGHSTGSAHILLLRVPASNVSIVFYIPLQQYQGKKVDSLGVPTLNVFLYFLQFERMPGDKVGFLGMPTCNVSILLYTL